MFTHIDAVYARMRHEEMLREAERRRLIAHLTAQRPSALKTIVAALRRGMAALRVQNRPAQMPTVRRGLAAE